MNDLYRDAMAGIREKVAMQEIRKVVRGKDKETEKLAKVVGIVHAYEEDAELAKEEAERREIEAEEAALRNEKVQEMFDDMVQPLSKLTIHKKGDGK